MAVRFRCRIGSHEWEDFGYEVMARQTSGAWNDPYRWLGQGQFQVTCCRWCHIARFKTVAMHRVDDFTWF